MCRSQRIAPPRSPICRTGARPDRRGRHADSRGRGGEPRQLSRGAGGHSSQAQRPGIIAFSRYGGANRSRDKRFGRNLLCGRIARAAADPVQSRRRACDGAAPPGADIQRSDPPPGNCRPATQHRRVQPHAGARHRHRPGAGRTDHPRRFRRTPCRRREGHSACRPPCSSASCCSSILRSGNRSSGSTTSPGCLTTSRRKPPNAWSRSGGRPAAKRSPRISRCIMMTSGAGARAMSTPARHAAVRGREPQPVRNKVTGR